MNVTYQTQHDYGNVLLKWHISGVNAMYVSVFPSKVQPKPLPLATFGFDLDQQQTSDGEWEWYAQVQTLKADAKDAEPKRYRVAKLDNDFAGGIVEYYPDEIGQAVCEACGYVFWTLIDHLIPNADNSEADTEEDYEDEA